MQIHIFVIHEKDYPMRLIYLWLLFIAFSSIAQNNLSNSQIDSLIKVNSSFIHKHPKESFELGKKIYWASKKNHYDIGIAMGLYKISLYHYQIRNDYKKALAYIDEGTEISKRMNNDSLLLYFAFGKGAVYGNLGFYKKADALFDECLNKTNCIKNLKKRKLLRGDLYTYKATFLSRSKSNSSNQILLEYYIKAMNEYEQALDKCMNPGYSNVGTYYAEIGNYDKADYYLKKAIAFFKLKKILTCEIEYTNLSDLNYKTRHYEAALQYLDSSNVICFKKPSENYYLIYKNYEGYKNIYNAINDKDSIIKYQNLEMVYKDSLSYDEESKQRESVSYIISKKEKENKKLEKSSRIIILCSLLVVLLIGVLIVVYYRRRNNTLKNKNLLKQKDFEKNLDQKATEIQQLKQKVITSYDELIVMAKKDNPLFISFFKELYPDFFQRLKEIQPDLTLLEQKVCFYLKLKFSTKDIAECTFVSVKAIQNRKNRLRKRLFIEDGKDIYDWIDQLG